METFQQEKYASIFDQENAAITKHMAWIANSSCWSIVWHQYQKWKRKKKHTNCKRSTFGEAFCERKTRICGSQNVLNYTQIENAASNSRATEISTDMVAARIPTQVNKIVSWAFVTAPTERLRKSQMYNINLD